MKADFDIESLISEGKIENELDYERAMIADRKLRILAKDNGHFKKLRKKLRDLIEAYEQKEWSDLNTISAEKIEESEKAELIAEKERLFLEKRKDVIKGKLKQFGLTQQDLTSLLGHKSKTYMSELMNGISPFTLKDLVVINRLLGIDFTDLIPPFLSSQEQQRVKEAVLKLNKPQVRLSKDDLAIC